MRDLGPFTSKAELLNGDHALYQDREHSLDWVIADGPLYGGTGFYLAPPKAGEARYCSPLCVGEP